MSKHTEERTGNQSRSGQAGGARHVAIGGLDHAIVDAFSERLTALGLHVERILASPQDAAQAPAGTGADITLLVACGTDAAAVERELDAIAPSSAQPVLFVVDNTNDDVLAALLDRNPAGVVRLQADDETLLTAIKTAHLRNVTVSRNGNQVSLPLADCYVIHDERGEIADAGRSFASLVGRDRSSLSGCNIRQVAPEYASVLDYLSARRNQLEAGSTLEMSSVVVTAEGLPRHVRLSVTLLRWGAHRLFLAMIKPASPAESHACPGCECRHSLTEILIRHDVYYVAGDASAVAGDEISIFMQALANGLEPEGVGREVDDNSGIAMPLVPPRSPIRLDVSEMPVVRDGETVARLGHLRKLSEAVPSRKERGGPPAFKSLIENVADLIILVDAAGKIAYASPSVEWILGYLPEEMAGHSFLAELWPEDRASAENIIVHGARTPGFITSFEFRYLHRDGKWRIFEGVGQNLAETSGASGFVITARDVTERKMTEEALRESEERFRQLAENTTQVFWMIDAASNQPIYVNQAFEKVWGIPPAEWFRNPGSWLERVHPDDRDRIGRVMSSRATDETRYEEYRILRRDGGIRWVLDRSFPIRNAQGQTYRIGGIAEDITQRKRYEERIIAAKEKAEEMARLKTALLTNMSHEIRTPLTGIIGFASVLRGEVDDDQREFVHLIERSGKRLMSTLNSVLDLARLEARQMETRLEVIDVAAHVGEVASTFGQMAREKGLELIVEAPSYGAFALLDRSCVDIILNNLIGNALKFTEQGEVKVAVSADDESVTVSVKDTGIGISPRFIPELFVEFKQESSGLTRSHEGSGLGLSITKRLVQLLGGAIRVRSEKGKGAEFVVTFARAHAAGDGGDGLDAREVKSGEAPAPGAPDRRLLIVEDNVETQRLYHYFLGPRFELEITANAEAAFQSALGRKHDAVLVDINLGSGNTGEDLLTMIRARPELDDLPLIAVTAYALPGDREYFLEYGFNGYVGKPFTKEEIIDALRGCQIGV